MRRGRIFFVVVLLLGSLSADRAVSLAQDAGSELVEPLGSEQVGDDAYVALANVDGFPASGELVIEPGTGSEEYFSYSGVDTAGSRLTGLTRPAPIEHPVGAFVQVVAKPTASADPTEPTPAPTPNSSTSGESSSATAEEQSAASDQPEGAESCGSDDEPPTCVLPPLPPGCSSDDGCLPVIPPECQGDDDDPITCDLPEVSGECQGDDNDPLTCDAAAAPGIALGIVATALAAADQFYPCAINPLLPCLGPGFTGAEITYYNEDGTVIFEDVVTLAADGTISTAELEGLRVPKRGSANVVMYWEQKTLLGATAYRFNQRQWWKWDHGELVDDYHQAYPSHMTSWQRYEGITRHDAPESECSRPPQLYTECQTSIFGGQFCNDIPTLGCLSRTYPNVVIGIDGWGHATGCAWEDANIISNGFHCRTLHGI